MARILDNLLPGGAKRAVKLHQQYEMAKIERDAVADKYEAKKNKELNEFVRKANKRLEPAAFDACNKQEYADCEMEEKLQAYDVKQYLSHRAVQHKAVKAIFKAVKAGGDISPILETMKEEKSGLYSKRAEYIKKIEAERAAFIAKHAGADTKKYDTLRAEIEKQYKQLSDSIDAKNATLIAKEQARFTARMDKAEAAINAIKAGQTSKHTLPDDVILSVKGLKMYFGGLRAVDDLTFDVKKGEIFGLIGPNGAGKTTVFNCITQFYKPTAGELLFDTGDGEVVSLTDYQVHDVVLKGIARTFQNIEVVKEVSVLDNLLIAATRNYTSSLFTQMLHLPLLKREERIIRQRADKVLKYMDLYAYRDRLAWGLPYGVLKRIEIARALMCNPRLIILDEPAAGLNESETHELANLINKIRKDFNCTILLVEHDMSLVMNICDHICAISFGKKLAYGTAAEVQSSKEVQEAYLGAGGE